jgi:hypothetical protein
MRYDEAVWTRLTKILYFPVSGLLMCTYTHTYYCVCLLLAVKSFCCRVDTHEIQLSEMCVFITSVTITTHNCVPPRSMRN